MRWAVLHTALVHVNRFLSDKTKLKDPLTCTKCPPALHGDMGLLLSFGFVWPKKQGPSGSLYLEIPKDFAVHHKMQWEALLFRQYYRSQNNSTR